MDAQPQVSGTAAGPNLLQQSVVKASDAELPTPGESSALGTINFRGAIRPRREEGAQREHEGMHVIVSPVDELLRQQSNRPASHKCHQSPKCTRQPLSVTGSFQHRARVCCFSARPLVQARSKPHHERRTSPPHLTQSRAWSCSARKQCRLPRPARCPTERGLQPHQEARTNPCGQCLRFRHDKNPPQKHHRIQSLDGIQRPPAEPLHTTQLSSRLGHCNTRLLHHAPVATHPMFQTVCEELPSRPCRTWCVSQCLKGQATSRPARLPRARQQTREWARHQHHWMLQPWPCCKPRCVSRHCRRAGQKHPMRH